ncbi:MAG: UDP-N-acetylglucosamine 2-epimerase (non-hydrolyzing) [Planctomycetes bacterium]|nr:UDP-N-acetylglucosamine 2-epimerase (non-hydrolyzing) [Planctomycetota bacterium]
MVHKRLTHRDGSTPCRPLLVMGTRPEAIKMAPVVHACRRSRSVDAIICSTGQHREMLRQIADYFGIQPDVDLELMQANQTLAGLTARCLEKLDETTVRVAPDCVVAQGDTTTVLAASMVAFYRRLPFVHVEAGLRTGDLLSPWPEEFNRRVAGLTTAVHCAPTRRAAANLLAEGVPESSIHITGNTVIDALLWTVDRERRGGDVWQNKYAMLGERRLVLITGHRRENFGGPFESICRAVSTLARAFPDDVFLYPVHLNPNVREPVFRLLGGASNIHLVEPAAYPEFVWLMDRATLILTDSGGVQEEAPSLRKPVLVMRENTERPEAVDAGAVRLVGTSESSIVRAVQDLLTDDRLYASCLLDRNPYGDGHAAERIAGLIEGRAWEQRSTTSTRLPHKAA